MVERGPIQPPPAQAEKNNFFADDKKKADADEVATANVAPFVIFPVEIPDAIHIEGDLYEDPQSNRIRKVVKKKTKKKKKKSAV